MKEKVTRNKTNKHSLTNSRLISRNCQKKIVHSSALQRLFLGNPEALQAFPLDVTALTVFGTCHGSGDFSKPKTTSRGCRSAFRQNEYVIAFLLLVWFIETPASFPLMVSLKQNIEKFSAIPFIKYGINWVLLAVLQEFTPPGKWLFLKLFSAIYITAVICKLKSGEGGPPLLLGG
ncbi:hypothetical protein WN943_027192 [Citrus x changshan-huyou]